MTDELRVLFFGDEIVAGAGDRSGLGLVGRLASECHSRGVPILAYNLGVAGETSAQIVLRLAGETVPRIHPGADCRIVLFATANDIAPEQERERRSVEESVSAYMRAIAQATAMGVPAMTAGPPPASNRSTNKRIKSLSAALAKACRAQTAPYLELHPRPGGAQFSDGDARYESLASAVVQAGLIDWLAHPSGRRS